MLKFYSMACQKYYSCKICFPTIITTNRRTTTYHYLLLQLALFVHRSSFIVHRSCPVLMTKTMKSSVPHHQCHWISEGCCTAIACWIHRQKKLKMTLMMQMQKNILLFFELLVIPLLLLFLTLLPLLLLHWTTKRPMCAQQSTINRNEKCENPELEKKANQFEF